MEQKYKVAEPLFDINESSKIGSSDVRPWYGCVVLV